MGIAPVVLGDPRTPAQQTPVQLALFPDLAPSEGPSEPQTEVEAAVEQQQPCLFNPYQLLLPLEAEIHLFGNREA